MTRTLKLLKNNRLVLLTTLNHATNTPSLTPLLKSEIWQTPNYQKAYLIRTKQRRIVTSRQTPENHHTKRTSQKMSLKTRQTRSEDSKTHSTSPPSSTSNLNQIGKKPKTTIERRLNRAETHRNTAKEGHHRYRETVAWFGFDRRQTERQLQGETNKARRAQLRCYESHRSWKNFQI